jgi:hypothetical protein
LIPRFQLVGGKRRPYFTVNPSSTDEIAMR